MTNNIPGMSFVSKRKIRQWVVGEIVASMFAATMCLSAASVQPVVPRIHLNNPRSSDTLITGSATYIPGDSIRVVVWTLTDHWYVQPSPDEALTTVIPNGTWSCRARPGSHTLALLVNPTYQIGSERYEHPSIDPGVLAWEEYPTSLLEFSGYQWIKKNGEGLGPGPNSFSDSSENIRTDSLGLHLRISQRNQKWYCPEALLDRSLGFGTYTYCLDSRVDSLDRSVVFSGFSYESLDREIDIEWTHAWMMQQDNMQYVVQPWYHSGNFIRFVMPSDVRSTHRFIWAPKSVVFESWIGWNDTPDSSTLIHSWRYTGLDIPPHAHERMRFNLWLFNGRPPEDGKGDEVIVRSFRFEPMLLTE